LIPIKPKVLKVTVWTSTFTFDLHRIKFIDILR
jgi:hypothetical protein